MRKSVVGLLVIVLLACASPAAAQTCAKIKDGTITDSAGQPVTLGYDQWGYNYQAHMFNGLYSNFSRPFPPVGEDEVNLIMKWSDEWLSNQDCNGDTKLDRGLNAKTGVSTGTSMGWLTNQNEGDYHGGDGDYHHYTYFVKIVWVGPAPISGDPWAGKRIWGEYAIIEEVYNDPYGGFHGVDRSTLTKPAGFGYYTN